MTSSEGSGTLHRFIETLQLLADPPGGPSRQELSEKAEMLLRDCPASSSDTFTTVVVRQVALAATCRFDMLRTSQMSGATVARRVLAFYAAANVGDVLTLLRSYLSDFRAVETSCVRKDQGGPRVARSLRYISEHATDPGLCIGKVAAAVRLSTGHLQRLLRVQTGETFKKHVRRARMERAVALLAAGQYSVKEIAGLVGCHSAADFDRQFKHCFQLTPTKWRATEWAKYNDGKE